MKYREHYWQWMYQNLRFSRYDRKFIHDVYHKKIVGQKPLSPNQAETWEMIVFKYQRQIQEQHLDPDVILAAAWEIAPRPPVPDHDRHELLLRDNILVMRSPYDKSTVDAWREFRARRNLSDVIWDPDTKEWLIPVTAVTLKTMVEYCQSSRSKYTIHDSVIDLLDEVLLTTSADQWRVSAKLVNDRIIINCANEPLLAALPGKLDVGLPILETLTQAGIEIDVDLRHRCYKITKDPEVTLLCCERATVMPWSDENGQAILRYLEQHDSSNVVVEIFGEPDSYTALVNEIMMRWPERVRAYRRERNTRDDGITDLFKPLYQFGNVDFGGIDILINRSRGLIMSWDPGTYPAKVAKKIIYYIDPAHDRDDYLDSELLLW